MSTLQKTFGYQGDLRKAIVKAIILNFKCPVYNYTQVPSVGNQMFDREITEWESVQIGKDLNVKEYSVDLQNFLVGRTSTSIANCQGFFMHALDTKNLDDFSSTIEVEYLIDKTTKIGGDKFDILYFFKADLLNLKLLRTGNSSEYFNKSIFLINRASYNALLAKLAAFNLLQDDYSLLQIISYLIDDNSGFPFLLRKLPDETRNIVFRLLHSDNPEPLNLIMKSFPDLFDFPILVPEIKVLEAAGTFTVLTEDNSKITKADLTSYDLLMEYAVEEAGKALYQETRFDLSTAAGRIQNNSVSFSFTANKKIVLNNIKNQLSIVVKGFDGSVLWAKEYEPDAPELKEIRIEVPLLKPIVLAPQDIKEGTDPNKKLRGQVIVYNKDCTLKDISVVVRAKKEGDQVAAIVGGAKTDNSGNFFMPYPFGEYIEAEAIVSLTPNSPVAIAIVKGDQTDQTISDSFLYLLVDNAKCPPASKEDDCDCHSPKKASRLPDYKDLINSDEYSQDLGGSCVNLSTPNRTLSEYSYQAIVRTSDPDVTNYTLKKTTTTPSNLAYASLISDFLAGATSKSPINTKFELVPSASKIIRKPVDLDNPIQWQDAPDAQDNLQVYQAVTIATGHILHYRSKFKADGYSLGDLLYSLALAPGQKKEIVVFDSTHSLLGAETQQITQDEKVVAGIVNDRAITDQIGGNINEALQGQSSANTSGISAGGGLGFSYGGIGASLGVAGGTSSSNASASQNSGRNISEFFGEKLKNSIIQNASGYRQLNASVVTTVNENQKYSATTEVVANHNHCHALTILYFEVLRHFAVYQELSSVEECVFVPFLMTNFSVDNISKWRDVLAQHLLYMPSNTFLSSMFIGGRYQHPLLKGFDANERIKTNYANVDFPKGRYCDETITSISGTVTIRANIPRPKTRFDRILSLPIIRKTVTTQGGVDVGGTIQDNIKSSVVGALTGGLSLLFGGGPSVKYNNDTHEVLTPGKIFDLFMTLDENYESVPPAKCIRVHNFEPVPYFDGTTTKNIDFFGQNQDDFKLWDAYASILDMSVYELLDKFSGNVISDWDKIFFDDIAPELAKYLISESTLRFDPLGGLDLTAMNRYSGKEQLLRYNFRASTTHSRQEISHLGIVYTINAAIRNAPRLQLDATLNVEDLTMYYSTSHYNGKIFSGYVGEDLLDGGGTLLTPLNFDEQKNPRVEDIFIVTKLIEHLNSNLEYYNKVLWYRLDPDRRYMLLDGFSVELYNDLGVKVPPRSLASVVKNQLITVAGNSLVFPVAAGYRVSNSFITEVSQDGSLQEVDLFEHYRPLTPVEPYRISVPSRGVFAETLQSYCNACEKIESDRLQDWNKFPNTDEPTPFVPVTTPTPTITDWKAAFKDFAPPMINIQNAPAEPAPAAGLTGLTDLLGKSGIFKDITGLDATQQTALKTYLSNQENAKAFAEMAKELAMQSHNTEHSDKITDSLKSAKDSGAISQDDYSKLSKQHLQQQIDGGKAQDQENQILSKKQQTSPITAAVDLAKTRQGNFSASETTSDGTQTADFKTISDKATLYDFTVPGTIEPIKQQTPNACWATVTTMMSNWKQNKSQSVTDYVTSIGSEYLPFIATGITLEKLGDFCDAAKLKMAFSNTEYPVSVYYDILQNHGPIWVIDLESSDPKMLHGRLLIGIKGDDSSATTMFTIVDPATGSKYDEALPVFVSKTENTVKTIDAVKDVQIPLLIYFKDGMPGTSADIGSGNASIGSGTDNQTRVRGFNPVNENTLVVDGAEGAAISNFTNWRALYKNPDGSFSEAKKNADRHFADLINPATIRYCAGNYRSPQVLDKIVLHETAGFGNFTSVSQFSVIAFPTKNPTGSFKAMPHFCINQDGSIIQFLDVCELANHGEGLNGSSIGIEFVNHPWGKNGNSQDGSEQGGITPLQIPAIPGYPSLQSKHAKTCLYVPSQVQLESLVTLLNALFSHPSLAALKQNWLNVININPKKLTTEKLDDLKAYFIINNAAVFLNDTKFHDINGNVSSGGWSMDTPGVYNHSLFGGHTDGMTQSFYTWLRIAQKMNATDSITTFQAFISSKSNREDGGSNVSMVDVSKIVFGTA